MSETDATAQESVVGSSDALEGVRVLDLTDELGAYASRLLSDLGADVIRVEPPHGARTRRHAPLVRMAREDRPVSTFELFVNAGKRSVTLDIASANAAEPFAELVRGSDVLIESSSLELEAAGYGHEQLSEINAALIHVQVTPFGRDQVGLIADADDLVVMAAGGLLHLGGYPDAEPVVAYGNQSYYAASIFAALSALAAIIERDVSGEGCLVDVSAQECVAQALEDSVATYALTGRVRERQGDRPREAGTGVYPCKDGYVSMVAGRLGTARAWTALVSWLNEEGTPGAEELLAPEWSEFEHRQREDSIAKFGEIFTRFTRSRSKQYLYQEAQRRLIALSPVSTVQDVMDNEQLAFRSFFGEIDVAGRDDVRATMPGPPYHLSRTEPRTPNSAPRIGQHTAEVLVDELGFPPEEYAVLVERGEA